MLKKKMAFTPKSKPFDRNKLKWTLITSDLETGREVRTEVSSDALEDATRMRGIKRQAEEAIERLG